MSSIGVCRRRVLAFRRIPPHFPFPPMGDIQYALAEITPPAGSPAAFRGGEGEMMPARSLAIAIAALLALTMTPADAAPAQCTLTVLHGLPDLAYDIYVNGELA